MSSLGTHSGCNTLGSALAVDIETETTVLHPKGGRGVGMAFVASDNLGDFGSHFLEVYFWEILGYFFWITFFGRVHLGGKMMDFFINHPCTPLEAGGCWFPEPLQAGFWEPASMHSPIRPKLAWCDQGSGKVGRLGRFLLKSM